jgi:hypothetical protein
MGVTMVKGKFLEISVGIFAWFVRVFVKGS